MMDYSRASVAQKISAIDQLIDDYRLIAGEKHAVVLWLARKISDADSGMAQTRSNKRRQQLRSTKRGLHRWQHDTILQIETYNEYIDGLLARRTQLLEASS